MEKTHVKDAKQAARPAIRGDRDEPSKPLLKHDPSRFPGLILPKRETGGKLFPFVSPLPRSGENALVVFFFPSLAFFYSCIGGRTNKFASCPFTLVSRAYKAQDISISVGKKEIAKG